MAGYGRDRAVALHDAGDAPSTSAVYRAAPTAVAVSEVNRPNADRTWGRGAVAEPACLAHEIRRDATSPFPIDPAPSGYGARNAMPRRLGASVARFVPRVGDALSSVMIVRIVAALCPRDAQLARGPRVDARPDHAPQKELGSRVVPKRCGSMALRHRPAGRARPRNWVRMQGHGVQATTPHGDTR